MSKNKVKMSGDMFAGLSNPIKKPLEAPVETKKEQIIDSIDVRQIQKEEIKVENNITSDNEIVLNKIKQLEEELQREKNRRKSLEDKRSFKRSRYEDFEVLAIRITKEQKAQFQSLSDKIKINKDAFERVTGNSLMRGLIEAFLKRADSLNLENYYSDNDVYEDIERLFK